MTIARPFVSTFQNRVDAKGRISVPARYREVLDGQGSRVIYAWASNDGSAYIQVGGTDFMATIYGMIAKHDPTSELRRDFAYNLLSEAVELSLDSEGRVAFPEALMRHAGIDDTASFAGVGSTFEVWEPRALEIRKLKAKRTVAENGGNLLVKNGGGATQ